MQGRKSGFLPEAKNRRKMEANNKLKWNSSAMNRDKFFQLSEIGLSSVSGSRVFATVFWSEENVAVERGEEKSNAIVAVGFIEHLTQRP